MNMYIQTRQKICLGWQFSVTDATYLNAPPENIDHINLVKLWTAESVMNGESIIYHISIEFDI